MPMWRSSSVIIGGEVLNWRAVAFAPEILESLVDAGHKCFLSRRCASVGLGILAFLSALRGAVALVATDGAQLSMVGERTVAPVVMITSLAVATDDPFG